MLDARNPWAFRSPASICSWGLLAVRLNGELQVDQGLVLTNSIPLAPRG